MATNKVSLSKCDSYDQEEVARALKDCLSHLGGIRQFVKPGQKVLIKPNALVGSSPDEAITTHPALIYAVVKEVINAGGIAFVGDSPGNAYSNVKTAMEKIGIPQAVKEAGGEMAYFQQKEILELDSPSQNEIMPKIKMAKIVKEADVIINLPKLKTHNLTFYTGAIKNMFGVVPGFYKAQFHIKAPDPKKFSSFMVDVFELSRPALNIMDAIIGMEGNGPSGGTPRKLGAIIASADAVALDAACSYLIGFQPEQIETTKIAHARKLGEIDLAKIEVAGELLSNLRQKDWKRPATLSLLAILPPFLCNLARPILRQLKINPRIDPSKCVRCLICRKNCPARTISYDRKKNKVEIDLKKCINCFCCHELCEYRAIKLKGSWLARILGLN